MARKKRKNGEGKWGVKTIHGKEYKYFSKQYPGIDNPKFFYGDTEQEVNEKRQKFEKEIESHLILYGKNPNTLIFGKYIEAWLESEKKRTLTQGAYDGYETAIRCRIKNLKEYDLYNKQMKQIDEDVQTGTLIFQNYVDALVEHGYALKTIKEVCDIISQCLDYASSPLRKELQYNYLKMVTMPNENTVKKKRKEIHFMTEDEMEMLYKESKRVHEKGSCGGGTGIGNPVYGNNAYAMVILQYTGMRIGELLALRWEDVDLEKGTIFIHRSLREIKNRNRDDNDSNSSASIFIEKETKTKNGRRTISITSRVKESLLYFKKYKKSGKNLVCVNKNGTHLRRDGMHRTLKRMTKNLGIYDYTLHELRHSFGSILLEKSDNVDRAIGAISRILGHANITITYNIYIHIIDARLTTTFQMLDYETMDKVMNEDDLDIEDTTNIVEPSSNSKSQIPENDGIDYKEKYEELLKSIQALQALIPIPQ